MARNGLSLHITEDGRGFEKWVLDLRGESEMGVLELMNLSGEGDRVIIILLLSDRIWRGLVENEEGS